MTTKQQQKHAILLSRKRVNISSNYTPLSGTYPGLLDRWAQIYKGWIVTDYLLFFPPLNPTVYTYNKKNMQNYQVGKELIVLAIVLL